MKTATIERLDTNNQTGDTVIRFEEGLIGFAEQKHFVLMENSRIAPLQLLEHAGAPDISFLVLDPKIRIPDYYNQIPAREWEALGVTDPGKRLAFVIVNIGLTPKECTGNFQAPILINFESMTGRQVILTDSGFCLRHPIAE